MCCPPMPGGLSYLCQVINNVIASTGAHGAGRGRPLLGSVWCSPEPPGSWQCNRGEVGCLGCIALCLSGAVTIAAKGSVPRWHVVAQWGDVQLRLRGIHGTGGDVWGLL